MFKVQPKSNITDKEEELILEDQTVTISEDTTTTDQLVPPVIVVTPSEQEEDIPPPILEDILPDTNSKQLCLTFEEEDDTHQAVIENTKEEQFVDTKESFEEETMVSKESESLLPPPPPKRSSQTNQRLKRWSKMIKHTLPSKMAKVGSSDKENLVPTKKTMGKTERKSLKERMKDGELAAFLKERRAVSESRFRILDKENPSPAPTKTIVRTKSDHDLHVDAPWGIPPGNISSLKEKFERQSSPNRDLKSPTVLKEMIAERPGLNSPSPERGAVVHNGSSRECLEDNVKGRGSVAKKILREEQDNSTTSPESGVEDQKKGEGGSSKRKSSKEGKSKKEKKDKKRHSTCEACHSDKEHKEHKRDKKRAKKDKKKKVTIFNEQAHIKRNGSPAIPPQPRGEDMPSRRDGFFKQLLGSVETNKGTPSQIQRVSRKCKSPIHANRPTFNTYLKEKKIVSESRFRRDTPSPPGMKYDARYLPPGVLQGELFFDHRSKFENGNKPVATFPRSLSNLEKRTPEKRDHTPDGGNDRPLSAMSAKSGESRCSSLPRPTSGFSHASMIDHEEYKNYILELMHTTEKSPRFQQLQAYYNILDRAMKLEKKSSSMEIHKLRSEAVIDFETWRKLRLKEKARDELDLLLNSLREAQKARQFHFRPKEVATVRWKGDIRLRGRDKSVENLKNHFTKIAEKRGTTEDNIQKIEELQEQKDVYKPLWRAKSVTSVAANIKR